MAFFFFTLPCRPGISAEIRLDLRIEAALLGASVVANITLQNTGNDIARDVEIVFPFTTQKRSMGDIRPNEMVLTQLEIGTWGPWPKVYWGHVRYKATDLTPLSVPFSIPMNQGMNPEGLLAKIRDVELGSLGKVEIYLENIGSHYKDVELRLLLPEEVGGRSVPSPIRLYPQRQKKVCIDIMNRWARPGSIYPAYLILTSTPSGGEYSFPFSLFIIEKKSLLGPHLPLVVSLGLLLCLYLFLRALESNHPE